MAKSHARKKREHAIRNGRLNASIMRGSQPDFSTHVRKTPSKIEIERKRMRQEKLHHYHY